MTPGHPSTEPAWPHCQTCAQRIDLLLGQIDRLQRQLADARATNSELRCDDLDDDAICSRCDGSGLVDPSALVTLACPVCDGTGVER